MIRKLSKLNGRLRLSLYFDFGRCPAGCLDLAAARTELPRVLSD